jgi:hypothetical protein
MKIEDVVLVATVREDIRNNTIQVDAIDISCRVEAAQAGKLSFKSSNFPVAPNQVPGSAIGKTTSPNTAEDVGPIVAPPPSNQERATKARGHVDEDGIECGDEPEDVSGIGNNLNLRKMTMSTDGACSRRSPRSVGRVAGQSRSNSKDSESDH